MLIKNSNEISAKARILIINFYNNFDDFASEYIPVDTKASIEYSGINLNESIILGDFLAYWLKINFNLGKCLARDLLAEDMRTIFGKNISNQLNVLFANDMYSGVSIVNEKRRAVKVYKGIFKNNLGKDYSIVKTPCTRGDEGLFAPLSVRIFLQHIINNLNPDISNKFFNELKQLKDKYPILN